MENSLENFPSERYVDKTSKTYILQHTDYQHITKQTKIREISAYSTFIFNGRLLAARFLSVYPTITFA